MASDIGKQYNVWEGHETEFGRLKARNKAVKSNACPCRGPDGALLFGSCLDLLNSRREEMLPEQTSPFKSVNPYYSKRTRLDTKSFSPATPEELDVPTFAIATRGYLPSSRGSHIAHFCLRFLQKYKCSTRPGSPCNQVTRELRSCGSWRQTTEELEWVLSGPLTLPLQQPPVLNHVRKVLELSFRG